MFGSFNKTLSYTIFYQLSLSTEELQDWLTHFKCACPSVTSAPEQKPEGGVGLCQTLCFKYLAKIKSLQGFIQKEERCSEKGVPSEIIDLVGKKHFEQQFHNWDLLSNIFENEQGSMK